jgi:glycosidase
MKKTLLILVALVLMIAQGLFRAQAANAKFQLPAVSDIAMYQVNPRVFAPSNSLNAVAARIDSISALGVNVMWVMPIYPIGKVKSKNSPYSISDYKAIAPEFGTINDLKHLVQVCHEHGMGIILDWVANHTAWDNVWMKDHKDWYTQDENGNVIYPAHTDWTDVADLNYDNREMRAAMIDAMKFWIVNCGIDGFRCDVADGVPADFWKEGDRRAAQGCRQPRHCDAGRGQSPRQLHRGGLRHELWLGLQERPGESVERRPCLRSLQ